MTDKERRDKRFRKLCKWMSEAGEIAEILREDCAVVKQFLTTDDEDDTKLGWLLRAHALRPFAGMAGGRGGRG